MMHQSVSATGFYFRRNQCTVIRYYYSFIIFLNKIKITIDPPMMLQRIPNDIRYATERILTLNYLCGHMSWYNSSWRLTLELPMGWFSPTTNFHPPRFFHPHVFAFIKIIWYCESCRNIFSWRDIWNLRYFKILTLHKNIIVKYLGIARVEEKIIHNNTWQKCQSIDAKMLNFQHGFRFQNCIGSKSINSSEMP